MKKYIGIKIVEAKEMTRGDYNKYRGWDIPENEDPTDKGYLVKYPDGYESWCPRKQFEEANRLFESPKDRVLVETQVTAERLNNLNIFMGSDSFIELGRKAKDLLYEQQRVMSKYVQILGQRLEYICKPFMHK